MAQSKQPTPPSNDQLQSIVGYIHNVTPVKRSARNNLYFNAYLQCEDTTRKIVSFDAEKQDTMMKASKGPSPVKFTNVSIVPSRSTDDTDIQVNRRSRLQVLSEPPFKRRKLEMPGSNEIEKRLEDLVHPLEMVTIQVQVLKPLTEPSQLKIYNKDVVKQTLLVADGSSSIPLNVWGDHIEALTLNASYRITHCSTRMFETLYLTTTPDTCISEIEPIEDVVEDKSLSQTAQGTIRQVMIVKTTKCPCKFNIPSSKVGKQFTTCPKCEMKALSANLKNLITLKINFATNTNTQMNLTCFDEAVKSFLQKNDKTLENEADFDSLENFFLLLPSIKITYVNDIATVLEIPEK